ncbi:glycosyl hydrolase family 18 [Phycicoccus endophyticus]|uniref:Glycosyl hydrolase family 18 n=1 Tax=Phycicoccus endophyticus TaxID=1690220 RepID=A0A7G9R008_9MICO|nr:glycosyl hydrolase family 18 [Phycicoccus endophyticus]NHI20793.1 glycosyl hydrolase family 18 [Phycicoccus endophyticus]QNN48933.1 glycosyl hydrolase family 18 [Phycicoccus endophyticus]GGL43995.1 exported chitinase [Phycicoccus endophyticus]
MELVQGRRLSWPRLVLVLVLAAALVFAALRGWRWFEDVRVDVPDSRWFAGYVDVTAVPSYTFEDPADASGENAVLSFVVASGASDCTPSWGGYHTLDGAEDELDLDRRIARLQQLGGTTVVSFGGQAGTELALACTDVEELVDAYRTVVERYHLRVVDLDVEGAALSDPASVARRAEALARLQDATDVDVWLTLPVSPDGLGTGGLDLVRTTLSAGVRLSGVNAMTMDYGDSRPEGQSMGEAAVAALNSTHAQLATLYDTMGRHRTAAQLWHGMGATPMVGQNDLAGEVFTLADAERLTSFATRRGVGRLSMWSLNRDRQCSANWPDVTKVSDSCSGVEQEEGEFSAVLGKRASAARDSATRAATPTADPTASVVDDPQTSPYPVWDTDLVYLKGQRVVWRQNVYVAKWWSSGDEPDDPTVEAAASPWRLVGPVLPGETPRPSPTVPEGTYPTWGPTQVYTAGDRVQMGNTAYVALWWNQGVSPDAPSTESQPTPWRQLTAAEIRRTDHATPAHPD